MTDRPDDRRNTDCPTDPSNDADNRRFIGDGIEDLVLSPEDEAALERAWERLAKEAKEDNEGPDA
jgi:hypothetical protein